MRRGLIVCALVLAALVVWLGSGPRPALPPVALPTPAPGPAAGEGEAPAAPEHPDHWTSALPATTGSAGPGSARADSSAAEGTLERLSGAVELNNISRSAYSAGADARLELTVASGTVRAYLQYFPERGGFFRQQDGYVFAEAAPGPAGSRACSPGAAARARPRPPR